MKSNVLLQAVSISVCCCTMTSLAMISSKYVKMTSSSGAPVCSTELPSQALPMDPIGVVQCGSQCLVSDMCIYFQLNSSTVSGQCQLYNTMPVNLTTIDNCVGFTHSLSKYIRTDLRFSVIVCNVIANPLHSISSDIRKSRSVMKH